MADNDLPSNVVRMTPREVLAAGASRTEGSAPAAMVSSVAVYRPDKKSDPKTDHNQIVQPWQREAYRHVHICGEARYAVSLFANLAARAEIGISEPQALARKAVWVDSGPEVDALAELAPTVRERTKLIRDYMIHRTIAGECYLIARKRVDTDPGYIFPPDPAYSNWTDYIASLGRIDMFDTRATPPRDPNIPIWEIVAVTEIQKVGDTWKVRHDNGNYLELDPTDPVIRLWVPDPADRRQAWSPFRSLLSTLREIEWLTAHIFTQVRSRLMSAGVWFLPDNLTFPPPPADAVQGGAEAIAAMNEAEQFMVALAASSLDMLDPEEVAFPTVVMGDATALAAIDKDKLIQFWSEIDDKAMTLRSDAIRRFALGMDLTPEQTLGSSGIAISGSGGSAGSVNHWGEWANEEKTIAGHIEPALSDFVSVLTASFLRLAVEGTTKVVGYNATTIRMKQDRSKEAIELWDRGLLNGSVTVREVGFDPLTDMMDEAEHTRWLLTKLVLANLPPEQLSAVIGLLTGDKIDLPQPVSGNSPSPQGLPGTAQPPSLDDHPYEGPPRVDHEQHEAPFSALVASCEGLVLRALEKRGNRALNEGKRGKDRDRSTPPLFAHVASGEPIAVMPDEFDFSTAGLTLGDMPAGRFSIIMTRLAQFCADLYRDCQPYSREALIEAVKGL